MGNIRKNRENFKGHRDKKREEGTDFDNRASDEKVVSRGEIPSPTTMPVWEKRLPGSSQRGTAFHHKKK